MIFQVIGKYCGWRARSEEVFARKPIAEFAEDVAEYLIEQLSIFALTEQRYLSMFTLQSLRSFGAVACYALHDARCPSANSSRSD